MGALEVPHRLSKEEAWESLQAKIEAKERSAKVIPMRKKAVWGRVAAAAAVLFVVGALAYVFAPSAEVVVVSGARVATTFEAIELPDGSVAMVTPETAISWELTADLRSVDLQGEAYFDVVEGAPFEVNLTQGKVEVLGTSFSVYSNGNAFAVECVTGHVRVSDADDQATLVAGQGIKRRNGGLAQPYAHSALGPQWASESEVSYTNADLQRVIRHVTQRFDVNVRLENIEGEREFSGTFVMADPRSTLHIIAKAMALEVREEGSTSYVLFQAD